MPGPRGLGPFPFCSKCPKIAPDGEPIQNPLESYGTIKRAARASSSTSRPLAVCTAIPRAVDGVQVRLCPGNGGRSERPAVTQMGVGHAGDHGARALDDHGASERGSGLQAAYRRYSALHSRNRGFPLHGLETAAQGSQTQWEGRRRVLRSSLVRGGDSHGPRATGSCFGYSMGVRPGTGLASTEWGNLVRTPIEKP